MADRLDIQNVLGQMRAIREQMQTAQPTAPGTTQGPSFAQQIQQAREQAQPTSQTQSPQGIQAPGGINELNNVQQTQDVPSFGDMFESAFNTVNENQKVANELATRYEMGDPKVDLPEVMIALQKSSVSFQAMTQVRNKMVDAYKDIMNMPI